MKEYLNFKKDFPLLSKKWNYIKEEKNVDAILDYTWNIRKYCCDSCDKDITGKESFDDHADKHTPIAKIDIEGERFYLESHVRDCCIDKSVVLDIIARFPTTYKEELLKICDD